jgi:hypothetical protein
VGRQNPQQFNTGIAGAAYNAYFYHFLQGLISRFDNIALPDAGANKKAALRRLFQ